MGQGSQDKGFSRNPIYCITMNRLISDQLKDRETSVGREHLV